MKKGVLIAILIIVVLLLGLFITAGLIYMQLTAEPYIPERAYLKIEIKGGVVESITPRLTKMGEEIAIRDLWYQISRARIDSRIKGIVIKISDLQCGFAKLEEIGRLLDDFRKSKKTVVTYIEEGGLPEYYLASFADKTFACRGGALQLHGLAAEATFLKNTLAKLGVKAQLFHIGDYKTASNLFTEDKLTPAHRESTEVLLNDIYDAVIAGVARNRKLPAEKVRQILDESPLLDEEYVKAGLLDGLIYEDEIYNYTEGNFPMVEFATYKKTTSPRPFGGARQIAVIFAAGEINTGKSGGQSLFGGDVLGSDSLAEQLRSARNNSAIKAVVLRVDSPGGSALASDIILREAELLAKTKPLIISMSDVAASGGYWISMSGARIFAQPQTITGSIGVITGKFVLKGLYDKIGINKEIISTSKYAGMYSDYREFSPEEAAKVNTSMRAIYNEFLRRVSANRKISVAEVDKIAQGRVWSGSSALKYKLVDQLGGLTDAIAEARKQARIPSGESFGIKVYPKEKDTLDLILEMFDVSSGPNPITQVEAKLKEYRNYMPALRMPYSLELR